jgi:hypothetical protein
MPEPKCSTVDTRVQPQRKWPPMGDSTRTLISLCLMALVGTACASRGPLPCPNGPLSLSESERAELDSPFCEESNSWKDAECALADSLTEKNRDVALAQWQELQEVYLSEIANPLYLSRSIQPIHYHVSAHYEPHEPDSIEQAFVPYLSSAAPVRWFDDRPPWDRVFPLASESSVIVGALAAWQANAAPEDELLALAEDAGAILLDSQQKAERLLFPYPDLGTATGLAGRQSQLIYQRSSERGVMCRCYNQGWWVDDLGGGELQSDNAQSAVAILALYTATDNPIYLESAMDAAEWVKDEPLVPTFHFNADSVWFLAKLFAASEDPVILEEAAVRAELGILPGQVLEGDAQGKWLSAQYPSLEHHFRILRGLSELLLVLPEDHRLLGPVRDAVGLGFSVARTEIAEKGLAAINVGLITTAGLLVQEDLDMRLPKEDLLWLYGEFGRFLTERDPATFPVAPAAYGLYLQAGTMGFFESAR